MFYNNISSNTSGLTRVFWGTPERFSFNALILGYLDGFLKYLYKLIFEVKTNSKSTRGFGRTLVIIAHKNEDKKFTYV